MTLRRPQARANHDVQRVLGSYGTGSKGPVVVITAGIHGNEPASLTAFGNVLETLHQDEVPLRGRLLGIAGNLKALGEGRRYIDRDLNRRWNDDHVARVLGGEAAGPEDVEQREILETLQPLLDAARRPLVFVDLHSTSGDGAPFACMADVLRNRPVAFALKVPVVLGLEEVIDGSMIGYLCDRGHIGVAVEGGQHQNPSTVSHHESVIWVTLVSIGAIRERDVPQIAEHRARLARSAAGLPHILEIRHRHVVRRKDDFEMLDGFANFDRISRGQVLAHTRGGYVRAPRKGIMMMPRYQREGDDGYFLATPVSGFWLGVSSMLRKFRLDLLVPLLPGVKRDPTVRDRLLVNKHVARFLARQIFHLFGFRHVREGKDVIVFTRRRPDFRRMPRR